jgi:hypothetical protein
MLHRQPLRVDIEADSIDTMLQKWSAQHTKAVLPSPSSRFNSCSRHVEVYGL